MHRCINNSLGSRGLPQNKLDAKNLRLAAYFTVSAASTATRRHPRTFFSILRLFIGQVQAENFDVILRSMQAKNKCLVRGNNLPRGLQAKPFAQC